MTTIVLAPVDLTLGRTCYGGTCEQAPTVRITGGWEALGRETVHACTAHREPVLAHLSRPSGGWGATLVQTVEVLPPHVFSITHPIYGVTHYADRDTATFALVTWENARGHLPRGMTYNIPGH